MVGMGGLASSLAKTYKYVQKDIQLSNVADTGFWMYILISLDPG